MDRPADPNQPSHPPTARRRVAIVDGSIDRTGALLAIVREARLVPALEFVLIVPEANRVPDRDLADFARVIRFPVPTLRRQWMSAASYPWRLIRDGLRLKRMLEREEIAAVQVNDFYLASAHMAKALGYSGRIVTWLRIDPAKFGAPGRLWLAIARRFSDQLVAVSRTVAAQAPGWPAQLLYDPTPTLAPAFERGSRKFVYLGNYINGKGQGVAVAAFERVAVADPRCELHFFGSTMGLPKNEAYKAQLEQIARRSPGASRIHFHAAVDGAEKAFAGAYAALNFSESESFSLTCQEASAAALPVIATRCGGPEEIISDGETGFLIPVGDAAAAADRMLALLNDPARAEALGRAGRERVHRCFSAEEFRARLLELFNG
ncbi:glycosyltransferase [Sphingomonas ginkgonis]|uniref:Glycosyltransferase n=1 Tax=Sphingomonas ginkgonis TaxID=2315330 RepID=A0A3R9Z5E3_9SPHN|nr:glycosyltransferase family 4 protein [Sphingomonas ginkgonis]RST30180.1 glycosyltransferase [Sphingomonas ginkgonis]